MLDTILHLDQILVLWTPCCAVKPQYSYESSQYNFTSLNVVHSDCKIFAVMCLTYTVSFSALQQNSIILTRMGPHKCQIIEYFRSSNGTYSDLVQTLLDTFLNMSLKSACFTDKTFFGGQKASFWNYSPQVPDYQDFWLTKHTIKGNFLY